MRWSRLPSLLLAINLLFFTSTQLLQWRWRLLPEDAEDFGANDGSWAAAVRHGSRLWAIAKQARKDYSVWSALAAETAGAFNEGVGMDSEAVQHLRGAFQQRADLSGQHASLVGGSHDVSSKLRGGDVQSSGQQAADASTQQHDSLPLHSGSADGEPAIELADPIPGDGTNTMPDPAIILFTCNRPLHLQQTLDSLAQLEGLKRFALYISQDGGDNAVQSVVRKATRTLRQRTRKFEHWQRAHKSQQHTNAWLSQHQGWGLDRAFRKRAHSHLIVVNDGMEFSPDFLLYFQATAPLLEADPTLWSISSFNDNSRAVGFRWDAKRMLRTSHFSGHGWMLRREVWEEISWSSAARHNQHPDSWMRLPSSLHDRDCIAPEVNRVFKIGGMHSSSSSSTTTSCSTIDAISFRSYAQNLTWHTDTVRDFGDISYLIKPNYEAGMRQLIERAQAVPRDSLNPHHAGFLEVPPGHVYLVRYRLEEYADIAQALHIWPFPRAHFQNIALLPYRGSFFLLADARACALLPESQRILPSPGMIGIAGQLGQSCSAACSAHGQACSQEDFWFLNTCKALRRHFLCDIGCAVGVGPDVPNYVEDQKLPTHHQCLVTQKAPSCEAKHDGTSRLCACIPQDGEADGDAITLAGNKAGVIKPKDDQLLKMGLVAA